MARARVRVDLDERSLRRMVRRFGDDALPILREAMVQVAREAREKMVELAPRDTGALESSAELETAREGARSITAGVQFTAPYAALVHELPDDARGPGTVAKGGNEFGPAGPKYMERVLRGFPFAARIRDALREFWRERSGG